jgi:glutaredoxin 3
MAEVTIYTTMMCGYCHRAKKLLNEKGQAFTEIDVGMNPEKRREMQNRSNGGYTVPQIFINGAHIGGSDELADLDRQGKLDALLAA